MFALAERKPRAVTLLRVFTKRGTSSADPTIDDAHGQFTSFAEQLRDAGVGEVHMRVLVGDPERVVSQAAASGEFSLVVMGPRCDEGSDSTLDSVTDITLQKTVVPVFLAPPRWQP